MPKHQKQVKIHFSCETFTIIGVQDDWLNFGLICCSLGMPESKINDRIMCSTPKWNLDMYGVTYNYLSNSEIPLNFVFNLFVKKTFNDIIAN